MFSDLDTNLSGALARSKRPEVRNPVLGLPCAARASEMPPEARDWLILFLQDLRVHARHKAKESLRKAKPPLFVYWSVVAVWSLHLVKVLRALARQSA